MPKNKKAWSSWNSSLKKDEVNKSSITYWLNLLQNLRCNEDIFLTLNHYFEIDQSNLSPEAMDLLSSQATWLMTNGDYEIIVEGHADEQGTRDYNVALGARRANSVKEYLNSLGIAASRIQTVSYGKERPIEICSNESCYSVNRRAVTVLNNLGS